ncbi:hypothetical protein SNEBB_001426 [Seison nebaliae]|nr:hypothetical protein SNEBB_001426 [Seison nebaliae]
MISGAISLKIMSFHFRAPGKIIISGEHSAVYGKAAIASTINLYLNLYATIKEEKETNFELSFSNIGVHGCWPFDKLKGILATFDEENSKFYEKLCAIELGGRGEQSSESLMFHESSITTFFFLFVQIYYKNLKNLENLKCLKVTINNEFPTGSGLGSSAAFNVCLSALFHRLLRVEDENKLFGIEDINRWAFEGEKHIHGDPSGVDNTIICYGNLIRFEGREHKKLKMEEHPKILLVDTKINRSTKDLVSKVRKNYDKFPKTIPMFVDLIGRITERISEMIEMKENIDEEELSLLFSLNNDLLNKIGVGHQKLKEVKEIAESCNFNGFKLTGAGGGGCSIIFIPKNSTEEQIDKLRNKLSSNNFNNWLTELGCSGLEDKSK